MGSSGLPDLSGVILSAESGLRSFAPLRHRMSSTTPLTRAERLRVALGGGGQQTGGADFAQNLTMFFNSLAPNPDKLSENRGMPLRTNA